MGVGTSLIAAERKGLSGIGVEKDTRYVNIARKRLRAAIGTREEDWEDE